MSADPSPSRSVEGMPPAPLTSEETRRLWRWERWMVRLSAMAIMMVAAALGTAHLYGDSPAIRAGVTGSAILVLLAVLVMHLRERCPRCDTRLASGLSLLLPDKCRRCGVAFPRPLNVDGELDN